MQARSDFRLPAPGYRGQRSLRAGAKFRTEVTDVGIRGHFRFQNDVTPLVVVDLRQRIVDTSDANSDIFAVFGQLGLEIRHLTYSVLVQQFLKTRLETGQVVGLELVQHGAVFMSGGDAGVRFHRSQFELLFKPGHRLDDLFAQTAKPIIRRINLLLQPVLHILLTFAASINHRLRRSLHRVT